MSVAMSVAALPTVQACCVNEPKLKTTPDGDPPTFIGGCGGDPLGFSLPETQHIRPVKSAALHAFHASGPDNLVFIAFAHPPSALLLPFLSHVLIWAGEDLHEKRVSPSAANPSLSRSSSQ